MRMSVMTMTCVIIVRARKTAVIVTPSVQVVTALACVVTAAVAGPGSVGTAAGIRVVRTTTTVVLNIATSPGDAFVCGVLIALTVTDAEKNHAHMQSKLQLTSTDISSAQCCS